MAEAETSSAKIAYAKEAQLGVNPGTGAKYLRFTSESLTAERGNITSEEVTGSRLPRENIRTSESPGGTIDFEFSVNNFDDILEGAMLEEMPAAPAVITGNITAVATGQKFTSNGMPSLAGIKKGQWFRTAGFTNQQNNGLFVAAADSTATEIVAISGSGIVDEAEGERSIQPSQLLRPGDTLISFSIEKQWTDVEIYELFTGMVIDNISMSMSAEQAITGSVDFIGVRAFPAADSSAMGTIQAAGNEQIASVLEALRGIREGDLASDAPHFITELSFQMSNALRPKRHVQSLYPFGVGLGIIECEVTLTAYLQNKDLINKYRDNQVTQFSWRIEGPSANSPLYIVTLPKARITSLADPIAGNSQDGFQNITLMAETSEDGVAIQIDKVPAIAP